MGFRYAAFGGCKSLLRNWICTRSSSKETATVLFWPPFASPFPTDSCFLTSSKQTGHSLQFPIYPFWQDSGILTESLKIREFPGLWLHFTFARECVLTYSLKKHGGECGLALHEIFPGDNLLMTKPLHVGRGGEEFTSSFQLHLSPWHMSSSILKEVVVRLLEKLSLTLVLLLLLPWNKFLTDEQTVSSSSRDSSSFCQLHLYFNHHCKASTNTLGNKVGWPNCGQPTQSLCLQGLNTRDCLVLAWGFINVSLLELLQCRSQYRWDELLSTSSPRATDTQLAAFHQTLSHPLSHCWQYHLLPTVHAQNKTQEVKTLGSFSCVPSACTTDFLRS